MGAQVKSRLSNPFLSPLFTRTILPFSPPFFGQIPSVTLSYPPGVLFSYLPGLTVGQLDFLQGQLFF